MKKSDFYYELPDELIAQSPLSDRASSKLLVLDKKTGGIRHDYFYNILTYLNKNDCLVLNDTKVIPARLHGIKEKTGAKIEVLLLKQTGFKCWEVLIKPGKRINNGNYIIFGEGLLKARQINDLGGGVKEIEFEFDGPFNDIIDSIGEVPLPPYITESLSDKDKHQTVYAKNSGSAAAPTAGFHFTSKILDEAREKGVFIANITLHIGLGTFKPVKSENIEEHKMHSEYYVVGEMAAKEIMDAKKAGGRIICVGTTSCRTFESCTNENGILMPGADNTDIFIYPGYKFKIMDALITNFHLPESTLIMLVSAFAGRENILNAYRLAVEKKYRFFSFGDAMLIK